MDSSIVDAEDAEPAGTDCGDPPMTRADCNARRSVYEEKGVHVHLVGLLHLNYRLDGARSRAEDADLRVRLRYNQHAIIARGERYPNDIL